MMHNIITNLTAVLLLAALLGTLVAVMFITRPKKVKEVKVEEPKPILSKEDRQWARYRELSGK